jgi:hypothetical protein
LSQQHIEPVEIRRLVEVVLEDAAQVRLVHGPSRDPFANLGDRGPVCVGAQRRPPPAVQTAPSGALSPPQVVTPVREADSGQPALERHDDDPKPLNVKSFERFRASENITDPGGDAITESRHIHPAMIGGGMVRASGIPITAALPRR